MAGGYRHGKRSNTPPKPFYIEDRVSLLESQVENLLTIVHGLLNMQTAHAAERVTKIRTEIRDLHAQEKAKVRERASKKAIPKKRKR